MAADLWVLGNLAIDDVVLADGTTGMGLCGGGAVFAALGGRRWSSRIGLTARVGPDFPPEHVRALESAGIQLVLRSTQAPSMHHWALYETADRRQFVTWLDSGSHLDQSLSPDQVPPEASDARVCHVAPMPLEVQAKLVRQVANGRTLVSLDPHDEYIRGAERTMIEVLGQVDLFLPSRREAALFFGRDAPAEAVRAFAAHGPCVVVVKLGGDGSLVYAPTLQTPVHVPAVPVVSVDPTGAGDAYCGAFAACYGQDQDPLGAACRATVAASFVVEGRGALAVLPFDCAAAEQRLAWLSDQMRVRIR